LSALAQDLSRTIAEMRLSGDDAAAAALAPRLELAGALATLDALRGDSDTERLTLERADAEARARAAMAALSELPVPGELWYFQMYSRRPGETFHEQDARFYDPDSPVERVNPLTIVVGRGG
jgi:hypothetical protein